MIGPDHPCDRGLTPECFEAYPQWAKRAFAYRLMHTLFPARITRLLPRALWEPLIGEGAETPPDVPLPPGTVVPPWYSWDLQWTPWFFLDFDWWIDPTELFPDDWKSGDPLPPGVTIDPGQTLPPGWDPAAGGPPPFMLRPSLPPEAVEAGPAPPAYTQIYEPGPPHRPTVYAPVEAEEWYLEPFNELDTEEWTITAPGEETITVVGGLLEIYAPEAGQYPQMRRVEERSYPTNFDFTTKILIPEAGWDCFIEFHATNHYIKIYFDPPSGFWYYDQGGNVIIDIGNYVGSWQVFKYEVRDGVGRILQNDVEIAGDHYLGAWTEESWMVLQQYGPGTLYVDYLKVEEVEEV